ncbi:DNA adenine methylase [Parapedobacter composti]|uniref:Site-specific DNA-methyltransferase (adenine-specific) n=1 Tax=Parapedobacter composti TaxID=623281 RepID=A0A1I1FXT8_9SPHI|nr:DNA adenine methylase [Parapedobacter composti]SFC04154.1 DNA adenine methylase [Parapedobacter composti]
MAKNQLVSPFLKWVGGKRQLIYEIMALKPARFGTYYEPFVGGGAVLFHLQPRRAVINDANGELINVYNVIKTQLNDLVADLKTHENNADYFYALRALDRQPAYADLPDLRRASRFIYLNKTCYNGLYRVNSAGEFNTPFGRYKKPNIVNEPTLKAVSDYLNDAEITVLNTDYETALAGAARNDFVYLDPPYHPVSPTSNFTGYVQGGWNADDQVRLRDVCDRLHARGVKFLLSNSAVPLIKELYAAYDVRTVKATRAVNSAADKRGVVDEYLIRNYDD